MNITSKSACVSVSHEWMHFCRGISNLPGLKSAHALQYWCVLVSYNIISNRFRQAYIDAGLVPDGKLKHLISDAATMQIIRWTKGGFGMAAHNYDGDMLTDEVAQVRQVFVRV